MSSIALLFPGQGAQHVGMGKDFAEKIPGARALYDHASAVLGYDLAALSFEGPLEKLTISAHAQPAIFVASVAAYTALMQKHPGLRPVAMAGLSSGEWTALHLAGVLSFEDTLKVLEARGRLMQEACEQSPGAMMSVIGAEEAQLRMLCEAGGAEMANLNSREQTVLSGTRESIDAAEAKAKELGIRKVIRLNVAGAFHSRLMKPAADRFAAFLEGMSFAAPSLPVLANVTGAPHAHDGASIREAMVRQVHQSVHWYHGIEWMMELGVKHYLECGPGKVLSGLAKRIDKEALTHSIQELSALEALAL
ncbi:MAG TPA: ACP S-malonyltransferase [Kiritimatiellia bacterium]|nr:ACP S-malonyltransferase [Kiritimatiellia bacterium]HMO99136.1 ACP S-malonyltransferase [Kiritimatiellia bacterium]HMP95686.1 ACP S-malonyltransferase [Kiritimatiellia bacterium]